MQLHMLHYTPRLGLYDEVVLVERSSSGVNCYPDEVDPNESAWVVGVARHRLWLCSSRSGSLCGYTSDSLLQMLNSGLLRVQAKHAEDYCFPAGFTDFLSEVDSVGAMKEFIMDSWSGELDSILVRGLNDFAAQKEFHPLMLSYPQIVDFAMEQDLLMKDHTIPDILLRVILLLLFNDTLAPLVPFLSYLPAKEESTSSQRTSLEVLRRCMLLEVKRDVVCAMTLVNAASSTYSSNVFKSCYPTMNLSPKLPKVAPYCCNGNSMVRSTEDSKRIFYIRSEDFVINTILREACTNGTKDIFFENRG